MIQYLELLGMVVLTIIAICLVIAIVSGLVRSMTEDRKGKFDNDRGAALRIVKGGKG